MKRAIGHGVGRHNSDEIYDFGKKDLKALSEYLAEKPYFFGEEPHLVRVKVEVVEGRHP